MQQQQQQHKSWRDQYVKPRAYKQGDLVFIWNFCRQTNSTWSPGTIVQWYNDQFYTVKLSNGQTVQRRADYIHECSSKYKDIEQSKELEDVSPFPVALKLSKRKITAQPPLHCSQKLGNLQIRAKGEEM